jgi:4-amino-4-deoxy-L-arabinose transferase-like glycosyltransferase
MNKRSLTISPLAVALLVATACLVPFLHKAVHVDDPLFLWTARQMQAHPDDPFGFPVNWYGTAMPMIDVISNPPLVPLYLALATSVLGWSELALHLAFLLPALAVVWGTFALAGQFCARPLLAALAGTLTPVFLVSATTLMCDVPMLAFWTWSLVCWERGLRQNHRPSLLLAGLLAGLAALSKFNGVTLLPLLLVYGLMRKRAAGTWLLPLLIPMLLLAANEWLTWKLYGRGLFLSTTAYAAGTRSWLGGDFLAKGATGLAFTGGCLLTAGFCAPLLWSRWIVGGALGAWLLVLVGLPSPGVGGLKWGVIGQGALFVFVGISVLALAGADWWRRRDATSLLLGLWVVGTFVYASFVNWTVNARGLLPMAPAVAILLARRIEERLGDKMAGKPWRFAWPLLPAGAASLLLAQADYDWAGSARTAAHRLVAQHKESAGTVWFTGHWGFQYYSEQLGARPLDIRASRLAVGDVCLTPENNSNNFYLPADHVQVLDNLELTANRWLATKERTLGASFFASDFGPLPFAVGRVEPERYLVVKVTTPLQLPRPPAP